MTAFSNSFLVVCPSKVKAYDADTPPYNDQVRYFLKEGDTDVFRINASTGDIFLLQPLDRETIAEYTLTLVAMDTGELTYSLTPDRTHGTVTWRAQTRRILLGTDGLDDEYQEFGN